MNGIPTLKNDEEDLFKKLVLDGLTLAAIRQELALGEYEDVPLIRKMIQVLEGDNLDDEVLGTDGEERAGVEFARGGTGGCGYLPSLYRAGNP